MDYTEGGIVIDATGREIIVGKYITPEGVEKPLYQKTIDFGALPNNTYKYVSIGVPDLETVVSLWGITSTGYPLPFVYPSTAYAIALQQEGTDVVITTIRDYSSITAIVTIQYTKTTD